ncbi:MAG: alpha/beta fold hydrolase, partial [Chlamydiae bacterium]|nr:alpha/beta fold hydrolase [Chlamydiota bacterium]
MFAKLLFLFLSGCALAYFLLKLANYRNKKITFSYLKKFFLIRKINSYKPCHPLFYCSKNKRKKAVLLLHGFSGAPDEMVELVAFLKQNDIPYLAPLFPGFGIGDFHLLNVVNEKDWVREAVYSYDLLAQIADKVDVIGHSNGGSIAIVLSSLRPINKL